MTDLEALREMLACSSSGTITTRQVTDAGLHRGALSSLVEKSELYRFGRGIYVRSDAWEDDFFLLQCRYERGIYSHDTALYLLGYSERTPHQYTMTFPKGYNAASLKNESLLVKRAVKENYALGIVELSSPCGNPIFAYDLERTLCDLLRGSGSDIQVITNAMKRYVQSKEKNIHKLMQYAHQLRVTNKIRTYLEVLL